jgi:hypothetical protein
MKIQDQPISVPLPIHTYAEFRQQIHGDLRTQHPEWVEPNGESSMRLMELLDALTQSRPDKSLLGAEVRGADPQIESAAGCKSQDPSRFGAQ